jgi:hypothetical protein
MSVTRIRLTPADVELISTKVRENLNSDTNFAISIASLVDKQLPITSHATSYSQFDTVVSNSLYSETSSSKTFSTNIFNSGTGIIKSLSTTEINSDIGNISNLTTDGIIVGHLSSETLIAGTGYLNSLTSNAIETSSITSNIGSFTSITGGSSTFRKITGEKIFGGTGKFNSIDGKTGHFSVLLADNFSFPTSQTLKNLTIEDSLTGNSVYAECITGGTIEASKIFCESTSGSSAFFTKINSYDGVFGTINIGTGHFCSLESDNFNFPPNLSATNVLITESLTGTNAYITDIIGEKICSRSISGTSGFFLELTGTNIYTNNLISTSKIRTPSIIGRQAFFHEITGVNIQSSSCSTNTIEGDSAVFSKVTSSDIVTRNLASSSCTVNVITGSSALLSTITGTNIYASKLITKSLYTTSLTGTNAFFNKINGTNIIAQSNISTHSILGVSASLSSINSNNISTSKLSANSITGSSCSFATFIGEKIYSSTCTIGSITGTLAYLKTITGSTDIYTNHLTSSKISTSGLTGVSASFLSAAIKNIFSENLTGNSAWFSSCSSNSFIGSSAFIDELVGNKIKESLVTTKSLIGDSASLETLTVIGSVTSSDIYTDNIVASSSVFTTITGTTIYASLQFSDTISGTNIYTSQAQIEAVTGSSAFFDNINSYMIASSGIHVDSLSGNNEVFSSCSIQEIACSSLTGTFAFFPVLSGTNIFSSDIDTILITSDLIVSEDLITTSITGCSGQFSKCSISFLTGNSALFSTITGTDIYTSFFSVNSLTGGSANFLSANFDNITASTYSANSISGNSAFLGNLFISGSITGSDIHTSSVIGTSAFFSEATGVNLFGNFASLTSIKSSTVFSSESIDTNGSVTSGSLGTFRIFSPVGESVSFNSFSGETMIIGTNIWNPDDLVSWTSITAGMGGNLMPLNYLFSISDDMKNIGSYNSSRGSVWSGSHYISKDGGLTWYPAMALDYDLNGGISVSRDGSLWIGTRTSTGKDGGIYRSIDGISFNQTLSVPGVTFKCCSISSNNQTVLVCTDSSETLTPFYISRDNGMTWKAIYPDNGIVDSWISDVTISYDGKYMLVLDKNGIFVSLDYGDSWCLRSSYMGGNRKIAMSQDGGHMYLSSEGSEGFQYSLDFGHTWITNSPNQGCCYSGIDCDKTGRYVYLIGDLSHAWLWFSNDYGKNFTMIIIPEMTITVNINVSSDGSKVMIYDGGTCLWFKKITSQATHTGKLTVNGVINCISGTFDYINGKSGHFSTVEVDNFVLSSKQVLSDLTITHSLTGGSANFLSAFISDISTSQLTGSLGYFSQITGSSCFFDDITGMNLSCPSISVTQLTGGKANFLSGFFSKLDGTSASFNNLNIGTITGANIYALSGVFDKIVGTEFSIHQFTGASAFFNTISGDNYFGSSISASQFTGSSCSFTNFTGENISALEFIGKSASFTDLSSAFGSIQSINCFSLTGSSSFFKDITGSTINTVGNYSSFEMVNEISTNILEVGTLMFDPVKATFDKTLPVLTHTTGTPDSHLRCEQPVTIGPDRLNISTKDWYISDGIGSGWCSVSHDGGISMAVGQSNFPLGISGEITCCRNGKYVVIPAILHLEFIIYVSSDFGNTYEKMKIIPSASIGVASHISSSGKYMSMLVAGSSSMSMYFSQNYGKTWNIATGVVDMPYVPSYMNHVTCNHSGKYWLTYVSCEIYVSDNYGASYNIRAYTSTSFPDVGSCCMSFDGEYMYCLDKNGYIYGSSNFGISWSLKKKPKERMYYSAMDCDSTGKYVILSQMNTGILEISNNYGDSFGDKLNVFGTIMTTILSFVLSQNCSEIYILRCSEKEVFIDVYKSRIPVSQKGDGILEVQGTTILNGDVNINSIGSSRFSEMSGSSVYSEKLLTSSITGSSGFFTNFCASQYSGGSASFLSGIFDSANISQLTGSSCLFSSISAGAFTGTSGFFNDIHILNGIQPRSSGGIIIGSDNLNNCKFSSSASSNSYFHMDSSSNVALFKVCNNLSASPMFQIGGTSDSHSTSSGALVVNGGVGVGRTLNASNACFGTLSAKKMSLPLSPSDAPVVGSVYFDVQTSKIFVYTGSTWKSVTLS